MYNKDKKSQFVSRAEKVSPQYDYSKTDYTGSEEPVEVVCNVHGSFWCRASNILQGRGCKKCAVELRAKLKREKAAAKFISQAQALTAHAGRGYSYEKTEYTGSKNKLTVTCRKHGDFTLKAENHLSGRGCPDCGEHGYRTSKPGGIYVLTSGNLTKLGITNHSATTRAKQVSYAHKGQFLVLFESRFDDGSVPLEIETALLADLRAMYKNPDEYFVGSTECFCEVDVESLLGRLAQLIAAKTSEQHSSQPQ